MQAQPVAPQANPHQTIVPNVHNIQYINFNRPQRHNRDIQPTLNHNIHPSNAQAHNATRNYQQPPHHTQIYRQQNNRLYDPYTNSQVDYNVNMRTDRRVNAHNPQVFYPRFNAYNQGNEHHSHRRRRFY
ncbi:hypothetical protein TWF106_000913 [Orbilia oligospora]|uniref:Uncharacterized protein n=1 Tax=Orbilia oligospora TaxID=2813651 RepID=A0A6G1LVT8_ORBOL|nr:hypothetical protein TWF106_000913 [Orbilia oligospora]KAF3208404.1 hypothetical protein TWF679_007757 [Orbilia oligospora]KAF3210443.1 hypothetical protein TWF191_011175 [Orbilia oligospora]KAF3233998.1 hypothetical protein TWF192_001717 [Orbilia oligospora]